MLPLLGSGLLVAGRGPAEAAERACPVLLELFTSQGCSSCPPADGVLSRLGTDAKTKNKVIPLAFHVDYWNRVGWTDPFSAPKWSQRQESYARVFGPDSVYTPQLVVNGRAQLNGSHEQRALTEIMAEPPCAGAVGLAVTRTEGQGVIVEATAEVVQTTGSGKLDLLVALFETQIATRVERGENRGRTLRNDFIVRRLETALTLEPKVGERKRRRLVLKVDPVWKRENLGVAAFLQDPKSMRVYGAASQLLQ